MYYDLRSVALLRNLHLQKLLPTVAKKYSLDVVYIMYSGRKRFGTPRLPPPPFNCLAKLKLAGPSKVVFGAEPAQPVILESR